MSGITVLSGGVGGAKLVDGLAAALPDPGGLTVIANTADDCEVWGLHVSPDVDTVLYTLAGLASVERGWGIDGDSWAALEMLGRYGMPTWFRIGDRDLATHLARTAWLQSGHRLTEVTLRLARALGVRSTVLPMSDDRVRTVVHTPSGPLPFQEYFVRRHAADPVEGVEFAGVEEASPSPEVMAAIRHATVLIVAPSNPVVSIGPILALRGVREALAGASALRIAVTPLVGGRAIKGPTVAMLEGLGMSPTPATVAALYRDFLDVFILDSRDETRREAVEAIRAPGRSLRVACLDTLMPDPPSRRRLACEILSLAASLGADVPLPA